MSLAQMASAEKFKYPTLKTSVALNDDFNVDIDNVCF